jgi:hypothetical protein
LLSFGLFAQAPEAFKYQSIARNPGGDVLANTSIGLRISIRDLNAGGTIVFQEAHTVSTNGFGLFSISIGEGTPLLGTIGGIPWGSGAKYMEIEADLNGGTAYNPFGTSQLLSVPYAIYSNSAGTALQAFLAAGTALGNTSWWNGNEWTIDDNTLFNDGNRVGIGTSTPGYKLDVNGHINIHADSAYRIGNRRMFWADEANIYLGENAGDANNFGTSNVFIGSDSGPVNIVGSWNTFMGTESGMSNQAGNQNTFIGNRAGYSNTIANENTYIGAYAGQFTSDGQHNSFVGVTTGNNNTSGSENSFFGAHAGFFNTSGSYNTLVGNFAGENSDLGNYNTALGFEADFASGNLLNAMALGAGAVASANNSVVIGNTSVTSIGGQVGWSTFSDARLKTNIEENTLGMDFIKGLRTVSYEYTAAGQQGIRYHGLIAQDVDRLASEMGVNFSGVVRPENAQSYYSLRYSEFVIPLIKAVQEQQVQMDKMEERIDELEQIIREISTNQKN